MRYLQVVLASDATASEAKIGMSAQFEWQCQPYEKKMVSGPFTRAQLAHVAGLSVEDIEFYQEHGLLQPPRRRRGRRGDVAFHREHVERLRFIRRALSVGYTLEDIMQLDDPHALVTCGDVYQATMQRVQQTEASEPQRAAALAQLAEKCPRMGTRVECPVIRHLKAA